MCADVVLQSHDKTKARESRTNFWIVVTMSHMLDFSRFLHGI